ncbi:MAG: hypothetical protein L3K08_06505, partial [Thermoplasmata archaeon]|nr:hypothetical protein [Thermoplasmata archaeon]
PRPGRPTAGEIFNPMRRSSTLGRRLGREGIAKELGARRRSKCRVQRDDHAGPGGMRDGVEALEQAEDGFRRVEGKEVLNTRQVDHRHMALREATPDGRFDPFEVGRSDRAVASGIRYPHDVHLTRAEVAPEPIRELAAQAKSRKSSPGSFQKS